MARVIAWKLGAVAAASSIVVAAAVALAFTSDRMETRLGGLGPQLVRVVGLIGTIYSEVSRENPKELIKDRERVINRISKDLVASCKAIEAFLKEANGEKTISIAGLEKEKREAFLALLGQEQREKIDKANMISMSQMLALFSSIRESVRKDADPFLKLLHGIEPRQLDEAAFDKLGLARSEYLLSLNRLVTFSTAIQVTAYTK